MKNLPQIKSAIKRVKVSEKKRVRNNRVRSQVRTAIRGFRRSLGVSGADSSEALVAAISQIDRAASKGVLHRNTAARRKSRLTKALHKMQAMQAANVQA